MIVIILARLAKGILKLFGRGATTFPGRLALRLDKNILKKISKGIDVVFVTGTNGKTTTARIIEEGVKQSGRPYFINRSGANLITGITAAFLDNCSLSGKPKAKLAIIECDENALRKVSRFIDARLLVVTNIFRDQLDRYGEVSATLSAIREGAENLKNAVLVLNADDPLSFTLSKLPNRCVTFGISAPLSFGGRGDCDYCFFCKSPLEYSFKTYSQLGGFRCRACGYERPVPDFEVSDIVELSADYSLAVVKREGVSSIFRINLGGVYNIYNALAAASALSMLGAATAEIEGTLSSFSGAFGRMESFGNMKMLLVKNPAGLTQAMNYIYGLGAENLIFVLNDKEADGKDVSWIWDAEIRISSTVKNIYAFGVRSGDMALRLKYAGCEPVIITSYQQFYNICEEEKTVIIPTYTAMMALRPYLAQKYEKESFWK